MALATIATTAPLRKVFHYIEALLSVWMPMMECRGPRVEVGAEKEAGHFGSPVGVPAGSGSLVEVLDEPQAR